MSARGYRGTGGLDLEIVDDEVPENEGRFHLSVREGRATVARGGNGTMKIDIRGLAALFSGFHDACTLRDLGELDGPDDLLAVADTLFAGRAPAMSDFF